MIDKFSVELRRHLVEVADEGVPAGQLESIQRLIAAAPQQSPWFVRLRWVVSPWAPYANAGVRAAVLAAAALLLAASAVAVVALAGSRGAPVSFEGRWASTDPGDGSAQTLQVGGGHAPDVHFEDAFASACADAGDSSTHFVADGSGEADRGRLVVRYPSGGCDTWQIPAYVLTYDHDSMSDTLVDSEGATWHRVKESSSAP